MRHPEFLALFFVLAIVIFAVLRRIAGRRRAPAGPTPAADASAAYHGPFAAFDPGHHTGCDTGHSDGGGGGEGACH